MREQQVELRGHGRRCVIDKPPEIYACKKKGKRESVKQGNFIYNLGPEAMPKTVSFTLGIHFKLAAPAASRDRQWLCQQACFKEIVHDTCAV